MTQELMPIEKQVTCLELSQELKKNGYVQEGVWWWRVDEFGNSFLQIDPKLDTIERLQRLNRKKGSNQFFVAPTVAELGEMLPKFYGSYKNKQDWTCRDIQDLAPKFFRAVTEANARAKMWLYLKKENLL